MTIDVHSANASTTIVKKLAGASSKTIERSINPEAFGISVGHASVATTSHFDATDLSDILIETCKSLTSQNGVFISVDEVQKIPEADMENICASVQMSMRKGFPVMLMLAGLPGSKEKVSDYPGCTFMQRTKDLKLEGLLINETVDTFSQLLAKVSSIHATDKAIWEMSSFSQGHPYLMQLIGYYLVEFASEQHPVQIGALGEEVVKSVEPEAMAAYRANVLDPAITPLGQSLRSYLSAMAEIVDETGIASTAAIAARLGKTTQQCSSYRERLLARRLVSEAGRGKLRFGLPHMTSYFLEEPLIDKKADEMRWQIR